MKSARIMTILTIGEGVLHVFGINSQVLRIISGILLLVRGIVITSFLMELAKIDAKGPRVLSQKEQQREEQARLVQGEQGRLITDLRGQLAYAEERLHQATASTAQQQGDFERVSADLHTARLHLTRLQHADQETARLQRELQTLSAQLHTAHLQHADLTAQLEHAKSRSATAPAQTQQYADDNRKITSINQVRARHEATGRTKVSHADVMAFLLAHPDLKRAEVAEHLQISERKVYEAIAWQKEQEQQQHAVRRSTP